MWSVGASFADLATAALPALTALMGITLGWLIGRGRERSEMRRAAYVEWQRAARNIGAWPSDVPPPQTGSKAGLPHPLHSRRLNDATIELSLIASSRVLAAAEAYLMKLTSGAMVEALSGPTDLLAAATQIDEVMRPEREKVTRLMRQDLRTRR